MKNQKGQSLIEVLAVLGIAVGIITAITTVVISSLNNVERGKNNTLATQYAQQGMEVARTMRQTNLPSFQNLSGTYCLDKRCTTIDPAVSYCSLRSGSSCEKNVDGYVREIVITKNASSCEPPTPIPPTPPLSAINNTQVSVNVYWNDTKCSGGQLCEKVQLVSCFSNYNVLNSP